MKENVFVPAAEIERQKAIAAELKASGGGRVWIRTFGCQQNEADSEKLLGICGLCGYTPVGEAAQADLVIINTCAIREHAELRALSGAGQLKKLKADRPDLLVAVCGCMVEQEHRRAQLFASYPYVDFLFGTDRLHLLPELLLRAKREKKRFAVTASQPGGDFGVISEGMPVRRTSAYRAWLPVMYGCNNFCTYCVVPFVRGRERSRDTETILREARELIESGCHDITLLGQNVNSSAGDTDFPGLMRKILELPGDFWLRFMTSHPKDASGDLVEAMRESDKAARHFHLPVQSGSDRILARMNRRYTASEYLEKVAYIRERLPDAAITSDVICGFPGETEADFEQTVELVGRAGFDMLYTFVYSPRVGSAAAKMEGQIPHEEKVRRFERLSAFQNERAAAINASYVGKTLRVLSDGEENGIYSGRCSQNKIVTFDRAVAPGSFAQVEITGAQAYALSGVVRE